MSELERHVRVAEAVGAAFYEWGRSLRIAIEPVLRQWEPLLLELADRGYEANLNCPTGRQEWDVFI